MSLRDPTWDERIFAACPPEIDQAQLTENLRRTPAERLARLQDVVNALEELQLARRRSSAR
jgi:hypothetical protein